MIDINRRKFIAELSKLLTFMYEEDRQTAISMYEKMFDDADDEQSLINFLVSPTRQAVIVARAYDAKERKLAIQTQSGAATSCAVGGELPGFIRVIGELHDDAVSAEAYERTVLKDQISIFGDELSEEESFDQAYRAVLAPDADTYNKESDIGEIPEEEIQDISSPEGNDTVPAVPENIAVEAAPSDDIPENVDAAAAEIPAQKVNDGEIQLTEKQEKTEVADSNRDKTMETPSAAYVPAHSAVSDAEEIEEEVTEVKRKTRVFPLILYILFAVPITALGVVVLLIPTTLFLALALALGAAGATALTSAFGGFAVFADIMVVLGTSLVIIALALLCLWVFIWFIGEVIVGLINGAIHLGGKIAHKEEHA